jgi:cytochrome c
MRQSMTMSQSLRIGLVLLSTVFFWSDPTSGFAAQSGADLYDQECGDCHSLARPPKNKKGPSLIGIMGQQAAAVPNFAYSEALRAAKILWTPDTMDAYIKNPKAVVIGGGKMKYDGLGNAAERAAIIEFLNQQR